MLALSLGIVFELLWLDALELGSVVPPYGSLSFLLLFPLCGHFGLTQPGALLLPLILCMMAAYLGSLGERRQRVNQNTLVDAVEAWCAGQGGISPSRALIKATWHRAAWQLGVYAASYACIFVLLAVLQGQQALPRLPAVNWSMLYVAALLGAVLSLRTRQAYAVLTGCLGMLAMLIWLDG